jgi:peptidoglycan/xylan/chitin deacetylase (PgdA/CDA1 family)
MHRGNSLDRVGTVLRYLLYVLRVCLLAIACAVPAAAQTCKGTLYLTIDTGWMNHAEHIAKTLNKHHVKATFFLANERTYRGDYTLDASWAEFWKARVAEGHTFGSHTWHHGYFRGDRKDGRTLYVHLNGKRELFDEKAMCHELDRVEDVFVKMTGKKLERLWRAPGGITTPASLRMAKQCGYRHVKWAKAGFLGDELPSETFPNALLLKNALRDIRDGDILVMHLGIRSRKDGWAPAVFDPLLTGLKARGFCFATMTGTL